jgi:prepilin-type N-terminal cleavage/methylation domain-containing protein
MRTASLRRGFSIPELMVVMTVMGILSGVLLAFYGQTELVLSRGISQTTLQQAARLASIRVIPKITSAVPKPETPGDPDPAMRPALAAIISPLPPPDESTPAVETREIVLNSIEPFVQTQLRKPVSTFNPRHPTYAQYRLFFVLDATKDQNDEDQAPGGRIGNLWMDGNTPGDSSDDLKLASNLYDITFKHETDNVIDLTVITKGWMRRAIGGRTLDQQVYQTRIHLPIYTYTPGGT